MSKFELVYVLLAIIIIIELFRAWRFEQELKREKRKTVDSLNALANFATQEIRNYFEGIVKSVNVTESNLIDKLRTLAHDIQQVKTGDEWSKKREHRIIESIKNLKKLTKAIEKAQGKKNK